MPAKVPAIGLLILVLALPLVGCSSPEMPPANAVSAAAETTDTTTPREIVDQFMAALSAKDMKTARGLLVGEAVARVKPLATAHSIDLLSINEDKAAVGRDPDATEFELECDVTYPQGSKLDQSGVYVYRLRMLHTADGWRIQDVGP